MIVQLVEIYELNRRPSSEEAAYSLREVFVNPEHVTCLREDVVTGKKIHLNRGLSGIDLTVVGDPSTIQEKLLGTKQLLKG